MLYLKLVWFVVQQRLELDNFLLNLHWLVHPEYFRQDLVDLGDQSGQQVLVNLQGLFLRYHLWDQPDLEGLWLQLIQLDLYHLADQLRRLLQLLRLDPEARSGLVGLQDLADQQLRLLCSMWHYR
ncbi:hypothetical protein D3C80_1307740 [compost metagenome]